MKKNLAVNTTERWRPPLLGKSETAFQKTFGAVRRFFDLQAGSIWSDVAAQLKSVRGRLLDVGCGAQPYRPLVPASVLYTGMDIAESSEKFGYRAPDTVYYAGGVWPVESSSVDFILCTETLEHVLEVGPFLAQAHRCLKSGGRLMLTVPFSARWHFIPYDYWRFTPSGLAHVFSQAGFKNIHVTARGNSVTVACYKNMALCLRLLLPQHVAVVARPLFFVAGILCLPLFIAMALAANVSLLFDGGDDCLGYTVTGEQM